MKNLVNNIFTAICLVAFTANLNACGKATLQAMPQITTPVYTASNLDQAPVRSQLLIKFKTGLTRSAIDTFHSKYGTKTIRVIPVINVHVVELPVDVRASTLVRILENEPSVKYAEVNNTIQLNPDEETNPSYSINSNLNYSEMIGRQIDINGVYQTSRSGAIVTINSTKLSIVDLDGTVVTKLPGMAEGSKLALTGIIKKVKGFNLTQNVGIMPVAFNKAK